MPANRNKLYITIIVICLLATGLVLYFGFFKSSGGNGPIPESHPVSTDVTTTPDTTITTGSLDVVNLGAPAVFPQDTTFDWKLVDSDAFQTLKPLPPLSQGPLGRDNPFTNP
ncbi:MAG TPA: hypothetical protein VFX17_00185 [Patescibacteria group bacterium]|nr:hypothetical protein [Patescibacteria group bacterium]